MGFRVIQVNTINFDKNKYLLQVELSSIKADIILLNELGIVKDNKVKIRGFNSIYKSQKYRLMVSLSTAATGSIIQLLF